MGFARLQIKEGEKLSFKALIEGAGYTIDGFASILALTPDTLYKWNTQKSNMPLPTFLRVAEILQVDPWLLLESLGYDMSRIPRATLTESETIITLLLAKAPEHQEITKN